MKKKIKKTALKSKAKTAATKSSKKGAQPKKVSAPKKSIKKPAKKKSSKKSFSSQVKTLQTFQWKKSTKNGAWYNSPAVFTAALSVLVVFGIFTSFNKVARDPASRSTAAENSFSKELEGIFNTTSDLTLPEKMGVWSITLRTNPTILNSFKGDDAEVKADIAPLIPAQFDCTTYVETVAALSKSTKPSEFKQHLLNIRYESQPATYFSRNHFPEADWIPNNEKAGNLKDVTAEVAKAANAQVGYVTKSVFKRNWFKEQILKPSSRGIAAQDSTYGVIHKNLDHIPEAVAVNLPYIPLTDVPNALTIIPSGSIINIVHEDSPSKPVLISHQGILIRHGDKIYFRHARKDRGIMDVPLVPYIEKLRTRSWQVVGINVNAVI